MGIFLYSEAINGPFSRLYVTIFSCICSRKNLSFLVAKRFLSWSRPVFGICEKTFLSWSRPVLRFLSKMALFGASFFGHFLWSYSTYPSAQNDQKFWPFLGAKFLFMDKGKNLPKIRFSDQFLKIQGFSAILVEIPILASAWRLFLDFRQNAKNCQKRDFAKMENFWHAQ